MIIHTLSEQIMTDDTRYTPEAWSHGVALSSTCFLIFDAFTSGEACSFGRNLYFLKKHGAGWQGHTQVRGMISGW